MAIAIPLPLRGFGPVPLAWRSLTANKRRLFRSSAGIGFAVLLMLMQLGFEKAFFDASLQVLRAIDGDIVLQSTHKYQFATQDTFPASVLAAAKSVPGVATARPLYADWYDLFWKNPFDGKRYLVRAFAFDPDAPVFLFPEIDAERARLKKDGAVLVDRRGRRFLGMDRPAAQSEINGNKVDIVGSFALGPDFSSDGTVVMSDRTFANLLRRPGAGPPGVEAGVIKVKAGTNPANVQAALRKALPADIAVMTKDQLIAFERNFQADVSSAGPIFAIGTIVGFVVGMLISYQVTYTEVADKLPQYATLKAIGYPTGYLLRVVLEQAALNAIAGWVPAWLLSLGLYRLISEIALLPLRMDLEITLLSLGLTLGMCLISAAIAVRRVIRADPAAVF
ncbi:MAG: ABC transporter permease DevC [Stellaceae bacterium]